MLDGSEQGLMECRFLVSLLQVHSEVRVQASQGFTSAGYFVTWAKLLSLVSPGRWVSAAGFGSQATESGQSWPVGISYWLWFLGYRHSYPQN